MNSVITLDVPTAVTNPAGLFSLRRQHHRTSVARGTPLHAADLYYHIVSGDNLQLKRAEFSG